jgi:N-formylglutamate deformylase
MTYSLHSGSSALLVSMPHIGTDIPSALRAAYVPRALAVEDTDWHLDRLYDFLGELGARVLRPLHSRYVIDLNRPPDDAPMYPGASNTELCPTRFFTGDALYQAGFEPAAGQRAERRETYWLPYHAALQAELERIKAIHGHVLLWDAHSIRSQIPWLFEGTLPGLNIGTASGASADASIARALDQTCAGHEAVRHVINGRFKGGYITRQYGAPQAGVHAVQLEMCQYLYMREAAPFDYDARKAGAIQPLLKAMVKAALAACGALYAK